MKTNKYTRIYLLVLTSLITVWYAYAAQNALVLQYLNNLRSTDSGQVGYILWEIFTTSGKIKQDYLELPTGLVVNDATTSVTWIVMLEHSTWSTSQIKAPTSGIINLMWDSLVWQIGNKQDQVIGWATTIMTGNLVSNRVLVSDTNGKVWASTVTSTELWYLTWVTSNVQNQLNTKLTTWNISWTIWYLPKFSATNIIWNSVLFESWWNLSLWWNNPQAKLEINTTWIGLSLIRTWYDTYWLEQSTGLWLAIKNITDNIVEMYFNWSWNVWIWTVSPSYKLHVNGDILANSWIRTTGTSGWYSETYWWWWHMTDTTWIRAYNSKSVYTPWEMQATTVRANTNLCIGSDCKTSWSQVWWAFPSGWIILIQWYSSCPVGFTSLWYTVSAYQWENWTTYWLCIKN